MELEKQVCSLEIAKRLKELAVEQQTLNFWAYAFNDAYITQDRHNIYFSYSPAFTVAELDEMLPSTVELRGNLGQLCIEPIDRNGRRHYEVGYWHNLDIVVAPVRSFNPADARAKMLIYLYENKLINTQ